MQFHSRPADDLIVSHVVNIQHLWRGVQRHDVPNPLRCLAMLPGPAPASSTLSAALPFRL